MQALQIDRGLHKDMVLLDGIATKQHLLLLWCPMSTTQECAAYTVLSYQYACLYTVFVGAVHTMSVCIVLCQHCTFRETGGRGMQSCFVLFVPCFVRHSSPSANTFSTVQHCHVQVHSLVHILQVFLAYSTGSCELGYATSQGQQSPSVFGSIIAK